MSVSDRVYTDVEAGIPAMQNDKPHSIDSAAITCLAINAAVAELWPSVQFFVGVMKTYPELDTTDLVSYLLL